MLSGRWMSLRAAPAAAALNAAAGAQPSVLAKVASVATATATAVGMTVGTVYASEGLHPTHYPWYHKDIFHTFDHQSVRRGFQVFRQVCSSCHGLERLAYRNLVNVAYTEDEMKSIASEAEVQDGPNDVGNMFTRKGKLSDYIKSPYANAAQARARNAGALPPDLSLIIKARPGGEDYVFALLTGYVDPPAGVEIREGLFYNPYFPGGAIAMRQALFDGAVVYDDGTKPTVSQMAKDVTTFLAWVAEPESDDRKLMGVKAIVTLAIATAFSLYWKRRVWAPIKTRKIVFRP